MSTPYKIKKPSNFVLGLRSYYLDLIKTKGFSITVLDILAGLSPLKYACQSSCPSLIRDFSRFMNCGVISLCFMFSRFILTQMLIQSL